jgi:hypothetical protein
MSSEIARISIATFCMHCHISQLRNGAIGDEEKLAVWIGLEFVLGILKNAVRSEFSNFP